MAIFKADRLTNERLKITITSPDICRSLPTIIEIRMISTITARVEFAWLGVDSTLPIIMIMRELTPNYDHLVNTDRSLTVHASFILSPLK